MIEESAARDAARRLLEFAGAGPVGRKVDDPVYQAIVEGRDPRIKGYSGCADAAHWLLFRMGVRSPHVNRDENQGWRPVVNVSDLAYWTGITRDCAPHDRYLPGDAVIIWSKPDTSDSHVMTVIEHDLGSQVLLVCEAGQGLPHPIALHSHQLRPGADMASGFPRPALFCGGRALQRWLPLMSVLAYANDRGELREPDLTCLEQRDPALDAPTTESEPQA